MAAASRRNGWSSLKAIFFDLDNTLISTRQGDKRACDKVAELLVAKGLPECVAERVVQSFLFNFRLCPANPEMGLDEWRHLLWSQALGNEYSYFASDVYQNWLRLRWQNLAISTDVASMLVRLRRRFLLGLITNGPSNAQWEKVRELGVAQYFDVVLVSGDLPWEKPDERIFREACNALGVAPTETLMVGDKLETDILGGRQAALGATVWVPLSTGAAKVDNHCVPDFTLKNILDLPTILSRDNEPPAVLKGRRGSGSGCGSGSLSDRNLLRVSHADFDDANSNASNASDGS